METSFFLPVLANVYHIPFMWKTLLSVAGNTEENEAVPALGTYGKYTHRDRAHLVE